MKTPEHRDKLYESNFELLASIRETLHELDHKFDQLSEGLFQEYSTAKYDNSQE